MLFVNDTQKVQMIALKLYVLDFRDGTMPNRKQRRTLVCGGLTPLVGSDWWGECFYAILLSMGKLRNFSTDRCYHLISRVANKAFYLQRKNEVDLQKLAFGVS